MARRRAFAFGGYALEYALGLWPQALSFALCTAGIVAAGPSSTRTEAVRIPSAAAAGFSAATAAGVRYQNAVVLAAVGGAAHRLADAVATLAACGGVCRGGGRPAAASAAINYARFGSWNPISKGPGYLSVQHFGRRRRALIDPFVMFWGQVVDYSCGRLTDRPPDAGSVRSMTGAIPIHGAIAKKGSAAVRAVGDPGIPVFVGRVVPAARMPEARRQQLRLLSIVAAAIIGTFVRVRRDAPRRSVVQRALFSRAAAAGRRRVRLGARRAGAGPREPPGSAARRWALSLVGVILFATPLMGGPDIPFGWRGSSRS